MRMLSDLLDSKHDILYHHRKGFQNSVKKRTDSSLEVTRELVRMGFPGDFAEIIGQELNTDFTAAWMLRYLRAAKPATMEAVADEMIEILEFRDRYVQKQAALRAQCFLSITES